MDVHGLAEFLGHSADVVRVDGAGVVVIEEVEDFVDSILLKMICTRVALSPNLQVIPSRNSSKSTYLPSDSSSEIILNMVGFLD